MVVVNPPIALMQDQVQAMTECGVRAIDVGGADDKVETDKMCRVISVGLLQC